MKNEGTLRSLSAKCKRSLEAVEVCARAGRKRHAPFANSPRAYIRLHQPNHTGECRGNASPNRHGAEERERHAAVV